MINKLIVGTRGSKLAVTQTQWVMDAISEKFPNLALEMKIIVTKGDQIQDKPLDKIGDKGLFTKALEEQLLEGRIDFAVHSLKDMPSDQPEGLSLAKVPKREDARDVLVLREGLTGLKDLPVGAKIGTGSKRRLFQILKSRPDIEAVPIRGNVETRIGKIVTENLDGVILAAAGIHRLGLEKQITEYLDVDVLLPSPAQGALGLQYKTDREEIKAILNAIRSESDDLCVRAERAFLKAIEGGCHVPVGAYATLLGENQLELKAIFGDAEGEALMLVKLVGDRQSPETLGIRAANAIKKKGIVYLVGAGPGDEGLITVKGKEKIEACEAIVYDRLASPKLVALAPADAERIYVGKAAANHAMTQEDINQLLVKLGLQGKNVVRLKGGDPYVFGRGGEEVLALKAAGVNFEVVPGITSPIAGLGYAGIPITHRGITTSFHVFTGQFKDDETELDFDSIATIKGTLVFLMSIASFKKIAKALIVRGYHPKTPAAIVSNATTVKQNVMATTLEGLDDIEEVLSPAFLVIGEVVALREELNWFESLPLFGKRILVTRATSQVGTLSDRLTALGAEVTAMPMLAFEALQLSNEQNRALISSDYTQVWFTSENAVHFYFKALKSAGLDTRHLGGMKVLAIGPTTNRVVMSYGITPDFIPAVYTQEGIVELMQPQLSKADRVLLPVSEDARETLEQLLSKTCEIVKVPLYRPVNPALGAPFHMLDDSPQGTFLGRSLDAFDFVTFTSASTAEHFHQMLMANTPERLAQIKCLSIGPITTAKLKELGFRQIRTAETHTIDGMLDALITGAEYETI